MKIIKQTSFLLLITLFVMNPVFSQENPEPFEKTTINKKKREDNNTQKKNKKTFEKQSIAPLQTPLTGCWQNTFGSVVKIESHDLDSGKFNGKYASSTGSSGVYYVHGYTNPNYKESNYPLTMTISWNTIEKSPKQLDNSRYWTSIMTGTHTTGNSIFSQQTDTLRLMNVITSAIEFDEVAITEAGNYPESLKFGRKDDSACQQIGPDSEYYKGLASPTVYNPVSNTLTQGTWKTNPSILPGYIVSLTFDTIIQQNALKEFAKITGKAELNGASGIEEYSFIGEASYLTDVGKASLSITLKGPNNTVIGLSGVINSQTASLEIAEVHTQGIVSAEYMANRMRASIFKSN